jgi:hypothetical protein
MAAAAAVVSAMAAMSPSVCAGAHVVVVVHLHRAAVRVLSEDKTSEAEKK